MSDVIMRVLRLVALLAGVTLLVACESVEERVQAHYDSGIALVQEGDFTKASLEFRNALKLNPDHVASHFEMAKIQEREGNIRAVIGHLTKVTDLDPQHVEAQVKYAQVMLVAGQLDTARIHAEAAYALEPNNPEVLAVKASVSYRLGNTETAMTDVRRALEVEPFHPSAGVILITDLYQKGEREQAIETAEAFLKAHERNLALNLLKLQLLENAGRKEDVRVHLEKLVGLFPQAREFRLALARFYDSEKQTDKALEQFRAIAAADTSNVPAALDVVRYIVRASGVPAARDELQRMASSAPEPFPFQSALATIDYQNGRRNDAVALLNSIIAANRTPDSVSGAQVQLAQFLMGERKFDEARPVVDAVLAADPGNGGALALRASMRIEARDPAAALEDLRAALSDSPNDVNLLLLSAQAQQLSGNPTLAGENFASAVVASDYDPQITIRYVRFLAQNSRADTIPTVLSEAVRRRPDSKELYTALAQARLQVGDWAGAEAAGEALRKLDATDDVADRIRAASLSGQGRLDDSLQVLEQLSADPERRQSSMTALVRTYLQTGKRPLAEKFLDDVLAENPKNVQALILKAALAEEIGNFEAASAGYDAVVAAEPTLPLVYELKSAYLGRRGDRDGAVAVLREGIGQVADPAPLQLQLAGRFEQLGRIDEAIAEYEALFARNPTSLIYSNNLVSLLSDHKSNDAAALARAVEIGGTLRSSNIPQYQDTFGWLMYLTGNHEEALRDLLPAVEALPQNPWVNYHIGMTYAKLNRPEDARRHLEAALSLADGTTFTKAEEVRATLAAIPASAAPVAPAPAPAAAP